MSKEKTRVKVNFTEMSDSLCIDCNRPIKKNVINRQPEANRCFVCYKLSNGLSSSFIKRGKMINLKEAQAKQRKSFSYTKRTN